MAEAGIGRRVFGALVAVAVLVLVGLTLDLDAVATTLADADPVWLVAAAMAYLPSWWLRGWRWQGLAADLGDRVPIGPAVAFATVGNMLNLVLPAKAGDLLWTHAAHERFGVPYGRGLVSVLAGRVLDLVVLLALGAAAFGTTDSDVASAAWASLGGLVVLLLLGWTLVVRLRLGGLLLRGPLQRVRPVHDALVEPAARLGARPARLALHGGTTLVIWGIEALVAWSIAQGLAVEVTIAGVFVAIMVANLSKIVPVTPASFGTYEMAGAFALGVAGVPYDDAFAVVLVEHVLKNGVNLLLGLVALWIEDLPVFSADLSGVRESWGELKG